MKYSDEALMLKISRWANHKFMVEEGEFATRFAAVVPHLLPPPPRWGTGAPQQQLQPLFPRSRATNCMSHILQTGTALMAGQGKKLREYLGQWEASFG